MLNITNREITMGTDNVEVTTLTLETTYKGDLAQLAACSGKLGATLAEIFGKPANKKGLGKISASIEVVGEEEYALFSGPNADRIVSSFNELEKAGDTLALNSLKSNMARTCKASFGFGCKVKGDQLIGTKLGAGKGAINPDSELVQLVKAFEAACTPEQLAEMITLNQRAIDLYAERAGATIKA